VVVVVVLADGVLPLIPEVLDEPAAPLLVSVLLVLPELPMVPVLLEPVAPPALPVVPVLPAEPVEPVVPLVPLVLEPEEDVSVELVAGGVVVLEELLLVPVPVVPVPVVAVSRLPHAVSDRAAAAARIRTDERVSVRVFI
jgi:hypothetical protein